MKKHINRVKAHLKNAADNIQYHLDYGGLKQHLTNAALLTMAGLGVASIKESDSTKITVTPMKDTVTTVTHNVDLVSPFNRDGDAFALWRKASHTQTVQADQVQAFTQAKEILGQKYAGFVMHADTSIAYGNKPQLDIPAKLDGMIHSGNPQQIKAAMLYAIAMDVHPDSAIAESGSAMAGKVPMSKTIHKKIPKDAARIHWLNEHHAPMQEMANVLTAIGTASDALIASTKAAANGAKPSKEHARLTTQQESAEIIHR